MPEKELETTTTIPTATKTPFDRFLFDRFHHEFSSLLNVMCGPFGVDLK
jgi:hypothetical protein